MGIIATEALRASNVIKMELDPKYNRKGVVVTGQATVLPAGVVLAKELDGTYAAAAAADVNLAVVVAEQAGSTTQYAALVQGPAIVSEGGLIFDVALTAPQKAALVAELEKQGIVVEKAI